jgi:hypothetical protein
MKKVITAMVSVLSIVLFIPSAANADVNKDSNIVIIDTGYDASLLQFKNKIAYEACFTVNSCPNGKAFQEGAGSAALDSDTLKIKDAGHGTEMMSASLLVNPNTKFIFIRAYGAYKGTLISPLDSDFSNIISWVYTNKDKLNVGAVVFSASRNITTSCPVNNPITNTVNNLRLSGIPVISAAGNNSNYTQVGFPACLDPIIAVGSIDNFAWMSNWHSNYSNAGKGLDFDAYGNMVVTTIGGAQIQSTGTSLAAQVFAASWMAIKQSKPALTYDQEYALIQKTQVLSNNSFVKNIPTLNLIAALKS